MVFLSHPNFCWFYDTSDDKNGYLLHFQTCMKQLNISYNPIIQQNVNNMICKILQERYYYLSECNKLYTHNSSLHFNYVNTELKCKEIQAKLDAEIAKNQQLLEKTTILQYDNNSTNQKHQELAKKNKILEESNIELNLKIIELKQKAKSVKECEEYIGLKNEEIENLKGTISADKEKLDKYQNEIQELKIQVSTTKENIKKSDVENKKLQNQLSTLQNSFVIADQKCKELQQRFDLINAQNQQLLKKNKFLEESNFGQSQKVTKRKDDKKCEELLTLKNEEIERMKKEIQKLIKEKEMIIIEFGERELKEQIKSKELEKKLKEYENQRNRFTSEIDKASEFVMEEVSRKRSRTTNNENQKIFANLSNTNLNPELRQPLLGNSNSNIHNQTNPQNSQTNSFTSYLNLLQNNMSSADKENPHHIFEVSATTDSTPSKRYETLQKFDEKTRKGYIFFSTETRKKIITENENAGFAEISKLIAIEWNKLSNEQKYEYESRAKLISKERAKYVRQSL